MCPVYVSLFRPPPPHFFLLFSLAAVNPDVYTGSSALAPACRVPGVLSAVRDVRQQTGMAWPAGRAVLDGSAVSIVDRQACGSDLPVTGCQCRRRATNQHSPPVIPPDYRQRGSSEFSTWHPDSTAPPHRCCTVLPLWLLNSVVFFIYEMHWCGSWLSNSVVLY